MKTFEIGKSYTMRSIGDHDCIWTYTVIKRTSKTITISDGKETKTCRVNAQTSEIRNAESIYPLGRYSMSPILSADAEEAPDSKLNPMCEKCANYPTDCTGSHEQVWTGCVHHKTAPDESKAFAPKRLRTLTDGQLLTAWEFTEHLKDPQCPTIRGWLMGEIERRYPVDFNAWLDQDAPEDSQLRHYVMGRS